MDTDSWNPDRSRNLPWVQRPWVGFDTETTGVNPRRDHIVTAAAVELVNPRVDPPRFISHTWLSQPAGAIPPAATQIHGITTDYARRNGSPRAQVITEICRHLESLGRAGAVLVVFNAGFDIPLLREEARRAGASCPRWYGSEVQAEDDLANAQQSPSLVVDPLVLDRALDRFRRGKRTLADLARHYNVDLPEDTHQADVDARLTLLILRAMVNRFPGLDAMTDTELHSFQVRQHALWAQDFEVFLRSKGRQSTVSRQWF